MIDFSLARFIAGAYSLRHIFPTCGHVIVLAPRRRQFARAA
jgi:hypothetical protein